MLCFFIKFLLKYKHKSRDYKIYHLNLNTIIIGIYFCVFAFGILWLRYQRWGFYLNLEDIFHKSLIFIKNIHFLYTINFILLIIIIILLLRHLRQFFIRELLKRHLYVYHKKLFKNLLNHIAKNKNMGSTVIYYDYYVIFIKKIGAYWSYETLIERYIYYNLILPYSILKNTDSYPPWIDKYLNKVLILSPKLILIFFFLFDCFYNEWILHLIFYYLPFYLVIEIFKNISNFFCYTNEDLNRIIYERYYEEDNILYINTTIEEDEFILRYITNGFRCFSHDVTANDFEELWKKKLLLLDFSHIFTNQRRFVKIDNFIYENPSGDKIDSREGGYRRNL
jgi:hypothetical protein